MGLDMYLLSAADDTPMYQWRNCHPINTFFTPAITFPGQTIDIHRDQIKFLIATLKHVVASKNVDVVDHLLPFDHDHREKKYYNEFYKKEFEDTIENLETILNYDDSHVFRYMYSS